MLKIGLTGGIGSGKSTVAKIFEALNVPVYYADDEAKKLMNTDAGLRQGITQLFGTPSYQNDQLNRKYIASIVFADPEKLQLLNDLVHPATLQHAAEWMLKQTSRYVIKEAALIFEAGANKDLDFVIGVSAPEELRISRTIMRDNLTREEVLSRMERQMDEDTKMKLCDYVVNNDEQQLLLPQVVALHEKFCAIAESFQ